MALGPSGEIFVSDGYGNFLVHKFSPEGQLIKTWGEPGTAPGQFSIPHCVGVDRHGTVYVCDRENDRIQTFTSDGDFVNMWTGLNLPSALYINHQKDIIYVVEEGGPCYVKADNTGEQNYIKYVVQARGPKQPRISIRDLKGNILSMWEGWEDEAKGVFGSDPHGIWVDSHGNIYETELLKPQRIQKFAKIS